ncbi:MAG: pyrroline-5-carboxylate reductase [Clostridia bacterium]|nr:pyrroline-5-carboxylate reductase [Clostridia bacterium]MBR7033553.1 pyrroline-5-carboxylate reductase [Clostridia bacterium]
MKRGNVTAFIGTGFMARAMIGGIVGAGVRSPGEIFTVNPVDPESAAEVSSIYGVRMGEIGDLRAADVVVFAIKPQQFREAKEMYREFLTPDKLYLSIMAGITTEKLEGAIPGAAVVRLMPNLALSVGKSSTAYAPGRYASDDDCKLVEELFSVLGTVIRVGEEMISSVTALSGSGPAYFCLLTEKLADAAKAQGMDPATADALALSTLIGTAKLLSGSDTTPEELRRRVTSKKGTTEAGVGAMLAAGFEKAVADGFNAARIRSDELSKD